MATYQVLPDLSDADYATLKADIAERGVLVPVEYDEQGDILDGHHRVRICGELGITSWPKLIREGLSDDEKRVHARQLNLARRHLDQAQKRALIADQLRETPEQSNRQIAAGLGVSHHTVAAARDGLEATGQIAQLPKTVGKDGKARKAPSAKPKKVKFVDDSAAGIAGAKDRAAEIEATETAAVLAEPEIKAKVAELSDAKKRYDEKIAALPTKAEALEISKREGGWVRANDGEMHIYVPPEQTKQYDIWLEATPPIFALSEPKHSAEAIAGAADAFWRPKFAAHLDAAIAHLTEIKSRLEAINAEAKDAA